MQATKRVKDIYLRSAKAANNFDALRVSACSETGRGLFVAPLQAAAERSAGRHTYEMSILTHMTPAQQRVAYYFDVTLERKPKLWGRKAELAGCVVVRYSRSDTRLKAKLLAMKSAGE